jgi:hypothetical protein
MANYRVSKVQVQPGSDGFVAEWLGGEGWSDLASNVLTYLRSGQHSFVMATPDGDANFVAMRDAAGTEVLVAMHADGRLVPLTALQPPAPAAPRQPERPLLRHLQKFLNAGSRL